MMEDIFYTSFLEMQISPSICFSRTPDRELCCFTHVMFYLTYPNKQWHVGRTLDTRRPATSL